MLDHGIMEGKGVGSFNKELGLDHGIVESKSVDIINKKQDFR